MKFKTDTHYVLLRTILVFLINIYYIVDTHANEDKLQCIQNLTLSEGLSHNGVTDILEDSKGYLWFATYDGLNRYDGSEVEIYKNTLVKKIFSSNRIRSIVEDTKGDIWIGTEAGIDLYEYSTESFKNIYSKRDSGTKQNSIIHKIAFVENGNIICLTQREGFLVFDSEYNLIQKYYPAIYTNQDLQFFDFKELDPNFWLFATNKGLLLYNITEKTFDKIYDSRYSYTDVITEINENTILLIEPMGLSVVEINKQKNNYIFNKKATYFKTEVLNSISIDMFNNLWVGTSHNGVIHVDNLDLLLSGDLVDKDVFKFKNDILRVSKVLSNTSSGCWVGTFNEGVFQFPIKENPFKHISTDLKLENGLLTNSILSIDVIDKNRVSLTANQGGEAIFNTNTHQFEELPYIRKKGIYYGPIFKDSREDIWLGCGYLKKILRLKKGEKQPSQIKDEGDGFDIISLRIYCEDKNGDLWIGGNKGLFRLLVDKEGNVDQLQSINDCESFEEDKISSIRSIYMDPKYNYLWIGTDYQGLYRIKIGDGTENVCDLKYDNYRVNRSDPNSLASNFISSIVRVPDKELWIGTEGGGFAKVIDSNQKPKFITFSEKDGLSNNVVKRILYDNEDNLWVSTNVGLNKFNTNEEWFQVIRKQDGLPLVEFDYAAQKLENGYMVFGGQKGFCYFNPQEVKVTDQVPAFQFRKFKLNNTIVYPGDTVHGRVLIKKRVAEMDEIILKHSENIFSIELAALHYSNSDNYNFKYKLSPLHKDWITIPTSQKNLDFNGLPHGHYNLEVMVSNSLNQWSDPHSLTIVITPPFHKTPLAIVLFILLLITVIIIVVKIRSNMLQLRHRFEVEQLEKNKLREVDEAKFKFFSNISHEFKTPLTLISGPIESLLEQYKGDVTLREKLTLVKRQSNKMSLLVDQVHDFRRSDKNILNLNFSVFKLREFIDETLADFKLMANDTNRELKVMDQVPEIYIRADRDKLEKVFNNILNNAFKFTKGGDFIRVKISIEERKLFVQILDSGKGIDKVDLPHVFERFYQSQQVHNAYIGGSGIGLAFSKRLVEMHYGTISIDSSLGHGATVQLELPIVVDNQEYTDSSNNLIQIEQVEHNKQKLFHKPKKEELKSSGEFADATIFLAEDNDDMRLFITNSLENHFKVTPFVNGKELLERMEVEWPDIIISDVLMPELNGLDLCIQVKNDIKTGHIPVILLTACTSAEDQLEGLKKRVDLYIKKPFNLQHLIASIENVLHNRKLLRERYMGDFYIGLEKVPGNSGDNIFLDKLYKLLSDNLDNPELELDGVARELGLNRTHFYQKVKSLTNETPFELLKSYRLKKAAEHLGQKQMSLTEVTALIGFKSTSHFSRAFKERYGISPSKYRVK